MQIWNQGKAPHCEKCGGVIGAFPVYKHIGLMENEVSGAVVQEESLRYWRNCFWLDYRVA